MSVGKEERPRADEGAAINLNQLPPWLENIDGEVREQVASENWSARRCRKAAARLSLWAGQLLRAADSMEEHHSKLAKDLNGEWKAGDPTHN